METLEQRISIQQASELIDEQKENLRKLWYPHKYEVAWNQFDEYEMVVKFDYLNRKLIDMETSMCEMGEQSYDLGEFVPLLSIGQMLEILSKTDRDAMLSIIVNNDFSDYCDELWKAVKKIL